MNAEIETLLRAVVARIDSAHPRRVFLARIHTPDHPTEKIHVLAANACDAVIKVAEMFSCDGDGVPEGLVIDVVPYKHSEDKNE